MRLLGRGFVVDRELLGDLAVAASGRPDTELTVSGTIQEGAKVFERLAVERDGRVLRVSVVSSLPFWNRDGSPDFRASLRLALESGSYEVRYVNAGGAETPIGTIEVAP